ncbi:MAG: tripartite tricarboxylate transporter TctB family protein [Sphaerochaetaceae bacterium]
MQKAKKSLFLIENLAFSFILLVVGLITILESVRLTQKHLPKNWLASSGGFMMIIGAIILLLFLFDLTSSIKKCVLGLKKMEVEPEIKKKEAKGVEDKANLMKMLYSFALLGVYTIIIRPLGFPIASTIYIGVNLWLLKNPLLRTIITVVVIFIVLTFGAPAFGLSLPRGFLGI